MHAFSNNGAGALAELLRRAPGLGVKLRGVVFDSAATLDVAPEMTAVVLGSVLGDLRRLEAPGAIVAKVKNTALAENVAKVFGAARGSAPTPMDAALADLVDETLPKAAPILFAYSSADKLITRARVEEFADRIAVGRCGARTATGPGMTRRVFDGSGHVRHLDAHPDGYASAVASFLEEALPATLRGVAAAAP